MDIKTALIQYINYLFIAGRSPDTLKHYQYVNETFIKWLELKFLPLKFESLNKEILMEYLIEGIRIRKWSKNTQWTNYEKLNVFFKWSIKQTYLQVNPLEGIPRPKIPATVPKALSEDEILELLRVASKKSSKYQFTNIRNRALIATFIFTGIRRSELINLKVEDVDLINSFLFVRNGKGGKNREIPIEQSILKPILEEYSNYRQNLKRVGKYFFTGTWAGIKENNALTKGGLSKIFSKLSKSLNKRIYPHQLRHSFATLVIDKNGDLFTLKELLGHSNIKTTAIYLSATKRKKIEVISKLHLK